MNDSSHKKPRLTYYYVFITITLVALFAMYFWKVVFVFKDERTYREDLRSERHKWRIHIVKDEGWHATPQGLAVGAGEIAERVYQFYKDAEQHVFVQLWFRTHPNVHTRLVVQRESEVHITDNVDFKGDQLDITPMTRGFGPFNINIAAEVTRPSTEREIPLFSGLVVRMFSYHALKWGAWLFFLVTTVLLYAVIFYIVVPEIFSLRLRPFDRSSARFPWLLIFLTLFLVLAAWYATKRCWFVQKKFDDEMAISNASLLLEKRFDTSYMFFRSRTRPGFISFVQPLVAFFPNIQITISQFPSDFRRRVWHLYDRSSDAYYGDVIYPEITAAAAALGLLALFLIYKIFRLLGVNRFQSCLAVLLSIFFYRNSLGVCITQTYNLFINLLAIYLYLRAFKGGRSIWMVLTAAGALSLAVLTKTTAVTSIVPIFFHQLYILLREKGSGRLIKTIVLYWLVTLLLPIIWFQGILGGFAKEYFEFWRDHLRTQSLNQYPATSLALSVKYLFEVFGVFLATALLGFVTVLGGKQRREEKNFFCIMWALGCALTFALPYIFPRFLKYFIPSFGYFSALTIAWVVSKIYKRPGMR